MRVTINGVETDVDVNLFIDDKTGALMVSFPASLLNADEQKKVLIEFVDPDRYGERFTKMDDLVEMVELKDVLHFQWNFTGKT